MKRAKLLLIVLLLVMPTISGCKTTINPETGAEQKQIDPEIAEKVEQGAEAGIAIGSVLSAFMPGLTGIVGIAAGALGAWKKIKPKLTEAQSESRMYYTATESVVTAVDEFKKSNPTEWKKLKSLLEKHLGSKAENVIRAIRGLPPIE